MEGEILLWTKIKIPGKSEMHRKFGSGRYCKALNKKRNGSAFSFGMLKLALLLVQRCRQKDKPPCLLTGAQRDIQRRCKVHDILLVYNDSEYLTREFSPQHGGRDMRETANAYTRNARISTSVYAQHVCVSMDVCDYCIKKERGIPKLRGPFVPDHRELGESALTRRYRRRRYFRCSASEEKESERERARNA